MENGIYAKFNTSKGAILVKLTHDLTPGTVGNFVALAEGNMENKGEIFTGADTQNNQHHGCARSNAATKITG